MRCELNSSLENKFCESWRKKKRETMDFSDVWGALLNLSCSFIRFQITRGHREQNCSVSTYVYTRRGPGVGGVARVFLAEQKKVLQKTEDFKMTLSVCDPARSVAAEIQSRFRINIVCNRLKGNDWNLNTALTPPVEQEMPHGHVSEEVQQYGTLPSIS
ncbi:hypothetical protein F2P81_010926 [Scophthalmus maximus]|uniref:Uncharacterized protein n=1 Tax=Scophthalmus maximus TaxID=52904 RepID=A0A6A4T772_SCOMX|nr:hypothetical protein F2P81_010926 [Scophthalmus maximus]